MEVLQDRSDLNCLKKPKLRYIHNERRFKDHDSRFGENHKKKHV